MKRKLVIAASITLLLAVAAIVLIRDEHQFRSATHNGKTVKEWAGELYASYNPRTTNAATEAFVAMGSNAVPTLRALISSRDPLYEKTFLQQARRIPLAARQYLFQKLKPGRSVEYRIGAIRAAGVLGETAVAALPELVAALTETNSQVRWVAAQAIHSLGPQGIAALTNILTNTNTDVRHSAIYGLGEAGTNALPAASALILATLDTNLNIRASTYYSLSRIGRPALPLAIEMAATHTNNAIRNAAFHSLIVLLPNPVRVPHSLLIASTNTADIRRLAILTLSRSRITNSYAVTLFQTSTNDEDAAVRDAAKLALERLNR